MTFPMGITLEIVQQFGSGQERLEAMLGKWAGAEKALLAQHNIFR